MSQRNVESVIGRLATDEAFRRRFSEEPNMVLRDLVQSGLELNECEMLALASIDIRRLSSFAGALDPRIQKCDTRCGAHKVRP